MDERVSFGLWLKQRRRDLRLTQEDLAERMACSSSMVRKIETGERGASQQMADLLAESFDIVPGERSAFVQFAQGLLSRDAAKRRLWQTLHTVQAHPTNLAAPLTALIGREQELERLHKFLLLDSERLFTLTGPPGIGKTRMALQVATDMVGEFEDGVFFVALAPISDPDLVPSTIAQTLGIKEAGSRPLAENLTLFLQEKQLLLVLDNFEQVVEAAPFVANLLNSCPHLKALVTSREVLHVHGEQQFPVQPLALPDPAEMCDAQALASYPSIALYVQRAHAVKPEFALTEDNAEAVSAICIRLDGLPLAIELAATRINLFSPREILARLDSRLKLLSGSARDLPPRQQTLRGAIDWSYNLLDKGEQTLFARLGVFVGGCVLPAVEAICNAQGDLPMGLLEGLASLVDKSLLKQEEGARDTRFSMLETIREYAVERLQESTKQKDMRRLHAEYYLALAESADIKLRGTEQLVWLDRLEQEHDNLRAALQWSIGKFEGTNIEGAGDLELGLRLAGALSWFWHRRGYYSEGRKWLEQGLARADGVITAGTIGTIADSPIPVPVHAKALHALGMLGWFQGVDRAVTRLLLQNSADIYRQLGDKQGLALSLRFLAACFLDDPGTARPLTEESVALCREVVASHGEDTEAVWNLAEALFSNGRSALTQGDYQTAVSCCTESLRLFKQTGDRWRAAAPILILGRAAYARGEYATARGHFQESLALLREVGDRFYTALLLDALALVARAEHDYKESARLSGESLVIWREVGNRWREADALRALGISAYHQANYARALVSLKESIRLFTEAESSDGVEVALAITYLGGVAEAQGHFLRAAQLAGAGMTFLQPFKDEIVQTDRVGLDRIIVSIRTHLGEEMFVRACSKGKAMTIEQALDYALQEPGY